MYINRTIVQFVNSVWRKLTDSVNQADLLYNFGSCVQGHFKTKNLIFS